MTRRTASGATPAHRPQPVQRPEAATSTSDRGRLNTSNSASAARSSPFRSGSYRLVEEQVGLSVPSAQDVVTALGRNHADFRSQATIVRRELVEGVGADVEETDEIAGFTTGRERPRLRQADQ